MTSTSIAGVSLDDNEPIHRRHPLLSVLEDDAYVDSIRQMRDRVDGATRLDGLPYAGPIDHALDNIRDFECSASSWTQEHLIRFQAVVLEAQPNEQLFPIEYAVSVEDKALKKMEADGFFQPTKEDISKGAWDNTRSFHNFFSDLLHILRGSRTPSPRTSPQLRNVYLRLAKENAKTSLAQVVNSAFSESTISPESDYHPAASPMSVSGMTVDLGPRKTGSYMLMHNLLKYIAAVELNLWTEYTRWEPQYLPIAVSCFDISADAERVPVWAGGTRFNCENDGAVYSWILKETGLRRKNKLPMCSIECKRPNHFKSMDEIIAQEVSELIALATHNYVSKHPSVEPKDEAYVLCCHHTTFHVTAAVVPGKYIEGIWTDGLPREEMLIVKRGRMLDLSDPVRRALAVRQILGVMRYLIKFRLPADERMS